MTQSYPNEIWKPIPGFSYEVSSFGRVRRINRSNRPDRTPPYRMLKLLPHPCGYVVAQLWKNNRAHGKLAHVLVAEAFVGPHPGPGYEVNHKNGCKSWNHYKNLEYMTRSENIRHAIEMGLNPLVGQDNPMAKLTNSQVSEIRRRYAAGLGGYKALGKEFGVTWECIRNIIKERTWKSV